MNRQQRRYVRAQRPTQPATEPTKRSLQAQAWDKLRELVTTPGILKHPDTGHNVVRLELITLFGNTVGVRAYTEEGDMQDGLPIPLLRALTRHTRQADLPKDPALYSALGGVLIQAPPATLGAKGIQPV